MNAERLLAHYEQIADAPDAIARLRRFVLDLAVRGKLLSQDPNDEPASELLKRIAKEKARLVKAGELRKPRDLDSGNDLNEPFAIPMTWRWCGLMRSAQSLAAAHHLPPTPTTSRNPAKVCHGSRLPILADIRSSTFRGDPETYRKRDRGLHQQP